MTAKYFRVFFSLKTGFNKHMERYLYFTCKYLWVLLC